MNWRAAIRIRSWWLGVISVGGLLGAIAMVGLVGLMLNARVERLTARALEYDFALEEIGNDHRVAALVLRHRHRNVTLSRPPSRILVRELDEAYQDLLVQIDRLAALGVEDPRLPQPAHLRQLAESYYASFQPAIALYAENPEAFVRASDAGLVTLGQLVQASEEIDRIAEERARTELMRLEQATLSARRVLILVLGAVVLASAGLAYATLRIVREQQETAQQLERALQAKTDFIADASHELRTPLTVLRGNAEVALELDRTGVHVEFLGEIVREAERMTRLVEDLLFLARSDSESLPLAIEPIAVAPFHRALAERVTLLARERGMTLESRLVGDGELRADRARIEQAVLILADNATKYSSSGQSVTLSSLVRGGELVIEVADRGPGIPPEELPFVFERFYRVDKARARKMGGAGLGLTIARTIVERHGGTIEAESQVGKGTTMRLRLPLAPAIRPEGQAMRTAAGIREAR